MRKNYDTELMNKYKMNNCTKQKMKFLAQGGVPLRDRRVAPAPGEIPVLRPTVPVPCRGDHALRPLLVHILQNVHRTPQPAGHNWRKRKTGQQACFRKKLIGGKY